MREYKKPEMMIERFQTTDAVAACTREAIGTETYYPEQTVSCLINGSETVFNSTSSCSVNASGVVYNGTLYICWKGDLKAGQSSSQTQTLMKNILAEWLGISASQVQLYGNNWAYHVAPASSASHTIFGLSY